MKTPLHNMELIKAKGWSSTNNCLKKTYICKNYIFANEIIMQIALLIKKTNHHPHFTFNPVNRKVIVELTTHSLGKIISEKDVSFALALEQAMEKTNI